MPLNDRFDAALEFASTLHRKQLRKIGQTPYIGHLLRVCGTVIEFGATEDEAIAALLHDALEDQNRPGLADEIAARFGDAVLEMVTALSDSTEQPRPPWRERKEAFLARLREATSSVRLIAAADKLDNVRSTITALQVFGDEIWTRFHGGREGTLWYYRQIVAVLGEASEHALVAELADAVARLEAIAEGGGACTSR
ncbi:MAG: HD domain-containing protein [Planctomycetota bacterium]|nr:MAG: HD domain-containing protein [Planctomycetota bacterium]